MDHLDAYAAEDFVEEGSEGGGKRCRSAGVTGTELCQHDETVAAEHGAEPVLLGLVGQDR